MSDAKDEKGVNDAKAAENGVSDAKDPKGVSDAKTQKEVAAAVGAAAQSQTEPVGTAVSGDQRESTNRAFAEALANGDMTLADLISRDAGLIDVAQHEEMLLGLWAQSSDWCCCGGYVASKRLWSVLLRLGVGTPAELGHVGPFGGFNIPERVSSLFNRPPAGVILMLMGACPGRITKTAAGFVRFPAPAASSTTTTTTTNTATASVSIAN